MSALKHNHYIKSAAGPRAKKCLGPVRVFGPLSRPENPIACPPESTGPNTRPVPRFTAAFRGRLDFIHSGYSAKAEKKIVTHPAP